MRNLNFALLLLFALVFFSDSWGSTLVWFGWLGLAFVRGHRAFLIYLWIVSAITLTIAPIYDSPFRHFVLPSVIEALSVGHGILVTHTGLFLARALVLVLMIGTLKLVWDRITRPLVTIFLSLLLLAILVVTTRGMLDSGGLLAVFLVSLTGFVSRFFLSAILFRQVQPRKPLDLLKTVIVFPFFQRTIPEWDQATIARPPEETNQVALFHEIIQLFFVVGICVVAQWWWLPQGTRHFWSPLEWGYVQFVNGQGSLAQAWLSFLLMPALYIGIEIWGRCNMYTLFIRVYGFNIPNSFNEPWKAHSFSDFMSRSFHYYSQCITYLFYLPLLERWRQVRKIRPVDQLWIAFLSIFLFAMIFHITREYWMWFQPSLMLAGTYFHAILCYSLTITFFICLSFVVERWDETRRIPFAYRFPIYFLLYAVIFTIGNIETDSLSIRWEFLKFLFTGIRNGS